MTYRGPCPPRVQEALRVVESWSHEWGLTFNVTKCQAIDISTLRQRSGLELRMHDALVTQVQEFRYLGVWVDSCSALVVLGMYFITGLAFCGVMGPRMTE